MRATLARSTSIRLTVRPRSGGGTSGPGSGVTTITNRATAVDAAMMAQDAEVEREARDELAEITRRARRSRIKSYARSERRRAPSRPTMLRGAAGHVPEETRRAADRRSRPPNNARLTPVYRCGGGDSDSCEYGDDDPGATPCASSESDAEAVLNGARDAAGVDVESRRAAPAAPAWRRRVQRLIWNPSVHRCGADEGPGCLRTDES